MNNLNFKSNEEVVSWIEDKGLDSVSYFPDFYEGIIGITTDNALVYSMKKMVAVLNEHDDITVEDAIEYINYNVIPTISYMPEIRPVILNDMD